MSKKSKQRQRMKTLQGSMVEPTTARTSNTPAGQSITNKMSEFIGHDFAGYGHLEAPEVHLPSDGTGTAVSGRPGLVGAQYDTANATGHAAVIKPVSQIRPHTEREVLPSSVARTLLATAETLNVDPDKVPSIPDDEVRRLINGNPEIAMEGVTRLGKVLVVPTNDDDAPTFNPLEIKARVVGDLRAGRYDDPSDLEKLHNASVHLTPLAVQVDVQAVYDRWMNSKGTDMYELQMAPPWTNGLLVYNTPVGNVWAMHMISSDITDPAWADDKDGPSSVRWEPQPPATHTIEWDRVRWVTSVQVYVGGIGQEDDDPTPQWVPTTGPVMIWKIAVYDDGTPADIHWTHIVSSIPFHKFNNAMGVLTETLNMLNCVNVTVAYPTRPMPRPQRRRFERIGVRFSEIHVRPTSKSYKGNGEALADIEMPLHGVRGHYANYGVDGRGLLFGKLAGRYWIPPHVRGSREVGTVEQTYTAEL